MIEGLTPYTDHKDSGLPWLREIPAHWNGRLFVQRNQTGFPDLPILEVSLKTGVRVRDFENTNRKQVMADREKYKRARQGDIAYNMMRMWQGAVGTSPVDGLVSPAYVVAKPLPDTESRYYQYLFRTGAYMDEVNQFSRGIVSDRNRLYWEDFKQMPSPFPPPEEQAAIVRFLDHADRRIRRYIRAKRQLIALLNEQKQAIIHRAVTCGLDPHVKLKPSGVEWLGDVPEHWGVYQARALSQVVRGGTPRPAGSPEFFHGSAEPWITVGELTKDSGMFLEATSTRLTPKGVERSRTIYPGTLLLTNSGATLGVPKITHIQGCINDGVAAFLRMRPGVVSEYLYYYWSSQTKHLHAWVNLGAQPNLNTQIIGGWPVLLPPSDEQQLIADFLTSELNRIANSLKKLEDEISLIQEYRTRLIADVVTGKLDVREAAAALPDELEAVEPDAEELLDEDDTTDDVELDTEPEEVEA